MKKTIISLVASLAIASSSLAQTDKVYVVVNGDNITAKDVAVALKDPRIQFESLPKDKQTQILNTLVEQKLLSKKALNTNIPKTKEYKEELKKLEESLAFQIYMRDLSKNIKVSEKDMKEFYKKNKDMLTAPAQLKASHILVKTKKEAEDIINELKKSKNKKVDFTKLAKSKSVGPSKSVGGELGWFTKEKMVPEFSDAALKLKVGEITTSPVQTQFGFHVIYLDDKKDAGIIEYSEIKNKIKQQLSQKKFIDQLRSEAEKLKSKAKIQYK
jgi:parvulin-like peptidyl-prolyl isomerase